jgi:uncharacterized ubiquitin-like protein YukD
MTHAVVTVEYNSNSRIDLALPLNISSHVLADAVAEALKLEEGKNYSLTVRGEGGNVPIPAESTLGDAGVLDGFILQIVRGKIVPPPSKESAFLEANSGQTFSLISDEVLVGRKDPKRNIFVDIDLTDLDHKKVTSRPHARLKRQDDNWTITDQRSANYTWVNGHKLVAGEPYQLNDGDEILFGKNGVVMKFVEEK